MMKKYFNVFTYAFNKIELKHSFLFKYLKLFMVLAGMNLSAPGFGYYKYLTETSEINLPANVKPNLSVYNYSENNIHRCMSIVNSKYSSGIFDYDALNKYSFIRSNLKRNSQNDKNWEQMIYNVGKLGKPEWHSMLRYVAELHKKSTHPPKYPFKYEWEEIGPGYIYGPAFGHIDITHQSLDVMNFYPKHALHQLLNNIRNQEPNGIIPGVIKMPPWSSVTDSASWNNNKGYPPTWVVAVQEYIDQTSDKSSLPDFFNAAVRQITWFENCRKSEDEGFFYNDLELKRWESGVDEGIRFDNPKIGKSAYIDATCHVYMLYHHAAKWADELKFDSDFYKKRESELLNFIQCRLFAPEDFMFYDFVAIKDHSLRHTTYENLWPIIAGAATKEQANKIIDKYILNPSVFLTEHPIPTVGINDPKFELRMWRGPAWNSITYWVARGCLNYGRKDAAKILLEKALDNSARQFQKTGTIWEFYHPLGGSPEDVQRKPKTKRNMPCTDYLGHNPLIAMAVMFDKVK